MTKIDMGQTFDYSAKTAELEAVLSELRRADIGLDEAMKLHEKGLALVDELETYLDQAEVEIAKKNLEA